MFLLDTNVISELRKTRPHGAVVLWSEAYEPSSYFVPAIAIYELQAGTEITRPQDAAKAAELESWIDSILATHQVLPLDAAAARDAARLLHGRSLDLAGDAMIAAIARTQGLTVATRNIRDFRTLGVAAVDPFLYRP